MSPTPPPTKARPPSFPRVSGDEPEMDKLLMGLQSFSPRERG